MMPNEIRKNGQAFLVDQFGGWVPYTDKENKHQAIRRISEGHPSADILIPYILGEKMTFISNQPMTPELIARIEQHLGECRGCYMGAVLLTP